MYEQTSRSLVSREDGHTVVKEDCFIVVISIVIIISIIMIVVIVVIQLRPDDAVLAGRPSAATVVCRDLQGARRYRL